MLIPQCFSLTVAGDSFIKNLRNENFSITIHNLAMLNTKTIEIQHKPPFFRCVLMTLNKFGPHKCVPHKCGPKQSYILVIILACFKYVKRNRSATSKLLLFWKMTLWYYTDFGNGEFQPRIELFRAFEY